MQLVNTTIVKKYILILLCSSLMITHIKAQENSPYSRYGLGDIVPSQNTINRAMGGISAAYHDYQSINFTNPASYANISLVTYDLGMEIDSRTLYSASQNQKYTSNNLTPSYLQLGIPLRRNWGMVVGLRPLTRVQYKISNTTRLATTDSVQTTYEGSGGLNEAYLGMGYKIGDFSFGANMRYLFGNRNISSKILFLNDTLSYQNENYEDDTHFANIAYNAGVQYEHIFSNNLILTLGVSGSGEQKMFGYKDIIRETFQPGNGGGDIPVDSVYKATDVRGKVSYPLNYNIGFMLTKLSKDKYNNKIPLWSFGAEYSSTQWSKYRFYGEKDAVNDSWLAKIGGEITPNALNPKSFWARVSYRLGGSYGKDYINMNGQLSTYAFTAGLGLPVRRWNAYNNQFTQINTAFEIGKRGNSTNIISENFFKITLGFCLSDIWFRRYKYD